MANYDARSTPPGWFRPVAVVALLWNLLGCVAYLADVTMKPEDIAKLTEAQQALMASRPAGPSQQPRLPSGLAPPAASA